MINPQEIHKLVGQGIGQPKSLTLNLATVIADTEFRIVGTQIGVWDSPNQTDTIQIRFNQSTAQQIPFKRGKLITAPFELIYITVPAGLAGNMVILYGFGSMELFRLYPNASEASETMADMLNELQGDQLPDNWGNAIIGAAAGAVFAANADRKSFEVQAGLGNAQTVWIGYTNFVTNLNAVKALVAGQSFWMNDYRGPVWAIAGGAGQVLHTLEV